MTASQRPARPHAPASGSGAAEDRLTARHGTNHVRVSSADLDAQVLELLRKGLTNREIARLLRVAPRRAARVRAEHGIPDVPQTEWRSRARSPKARRVRVLLDEGYSNAEVARRADVHTDTVARARRAGSFGPATVPAPRTRTRYGLLLDGPGTRSLFERWAAKLLVVDGGHLVWTGTMSRRGPQASPTLKAGSRNVSPRRLSFEWAMGRVPVDNVTAECGLPGCCAPDHVDDGPGRTAVRLRLRAVHGIALPPAVCRNGHDQTIHGRIGSDGCSRCTVCRAVSRRTRITREKGINPA